MPNQIFSSQKLLAPARVDPSELKSRVSEPENPSSFILELPDEECIIGVVVAVITFVKSLEINV